MDSLYLALSCLQGRPMQQAFRDICALGPHGIQLTPGCMPTPGFAHQVASSGRAWRTHHGFSWTRRKRQVWDDGRCLAHAHSVHPPATADAGWLEHWSTLSNTPALEGMVPGSVLGTGAALEHAMDLGIRLAIDVSHLYIQTVQGVLSAATWRKLQAYEAIEEVHVSHNDGRHDLHAPVQPNSFGLAWARERTSTGVPLILEAYLHSLSTAARQQQVDLLVR